MTETVVAVSVAVALTLVTIVFFRLHYPSVPFSSSEITVVSGAYLVSSLAGILLFKWLKRPGKGG